MAPTIRGELEKGNSSPVHCGHYARGVPSQGDNGQKKHSGNEREARKVNGDVRGECRKLWQIAEPILAFLGG